MFDKQSVERIVRSVLKSEREINDKKLHGEQYRDMPTFNLIRGKIATAFTGATGTFLLREIVALGQSSPYPGTEVVVVNVNKTSGSANGTAYAIYNYAVEYPTGTGAGTSSGTGTGDGNWELFTAGTGGGGGTTLVIGVYVTEVPAASVTVSGTAPNLSLSFSHGYAPQAVVIVTKNSGNTGWIAEADGTGTAVRMVGGVNFSHSRLRASAASPIAMLGFLDTLAGTGTGTGTGDFFPDVDVFIPANWDMSSLHGLSLGQIQVPYKDVSTREFVLGQEACGTGT